MKKIRFSEVPFMKRPSPARIRFGERLRNLREEKNLSQKEVAAVIGRTNRSVSNYENGTNYPNPEIIELLAGLFGVSVSFLTGGSDEEDRILLTSIEIQLIKGMRCQSPNVRAKIYATALEGTVYADGNGYPDLLRNYLKSDND